MLLLGMEQTIMKNYLNKISFSKIIKIKKKPTVHFEQILSQQKIFAI